MQYAVCMIPNGHWYIEHWPVELNFKTSWSVGLVIKCIVCVLCNQNWHPAILTCNIQRNFIRTLQQSGIGYSACLTEEPVCFISKANIHLINPLALARGMPQAITIWSPAVYTLKLGSTAPLNRTISTVRRGQSRKPISSTRVRLQ